MACPEWYTSVDSRRLSTAELKSKAFSAVDSGACRRRGWQPGTQAGGTPNAALAASSELPGYPEGWILGQRR
eukprot:401402-Pyramimonas_sp.AAC.1